MSGKMKMSLEVYNNIMSEHRRMLAVVMDIAVDYQDGDRSSGSVKAWDFLKKFRFTQIEEEESHV